MELSQLCPDASLISNLAVQELHSDFGNTNKEMEGVQLIDERIKKTRRLKRTNASNIVALKQKFLQLNKTGFGAETNF